MKEVLWYLLAGTRGGIMRARIISILKKRPYNAHQIAKQLKIDYKTATHHLNVLKKNNVVVSQGKYGAIYVLSDFMEHHMDIFNSIWDKIGKE